MSKFVKGLGAAAGLVVIGLSSQVSAGEGFYVGGQIGSTILGHSIERNTGGAANPPVLSGGSQPSITTFSEESDVSVGLHLGYKKMVTDDAFLAAELFYNNESSETTNLNGLLRADLELEASYGVNFKAGVEVTDKLSVYGIAGATWLDLDVRNSYVFASPVKYGSEDEVALSLGVGAEYSVNNNWSVKAEYTRVNDVDFDAPKEVVLNQFNPNEAEYDNFNVSLSYYF
ncbi:outer membrane protein [Neptuniibacter sp. QD48_55]|uniref:outer membrane protein n=1 Tax=Neptuniibacter sp. QD48_55 TaxID=3398212 RepID=UPI0039F55234